jgi:C_GCAxxG_C_C family probable redox protein
MTKADSARTTMVAGKMNCAQSTLTAFCEELGLDRKTALKLAMGFGGGVGGMGKTCGAVTGAFMVLGLRLDLTPKNHDEMRTEIHRVMDEFKDKFVAIRGSTDCKDLLGVDLGRPGGTEAAREKGLFATVCPGIVYDAVKILEGMGEGK